MQDVCTDAQMITLLAQAQRGDSAAYDKLYSLYADKIFRYLFARLGQREIAEDLTADVFVRLIQVLPRYKVSSARPVASFSAWLYRIAGNLLTDHYRRQQHRRHLDLAEQVEQSSGNPGPDHCAVVSEEGQLLAAAITDLATEQQLVVLYRFAEQLSVQEVAELMGKTAGAVKALQFRALANLRRILLPE
jgi:RNA polymerase sigma-70 factor, ECF subfamily